MKTRLALAAALLIAAPAGSQPVELPPVSYPDLPARASNAAGFVPAGWEVLVRRQGDLNGDGARDLVLLLKLRDPANIVGIPMGHESRRLDTNPHLLLVAFAERGGYRRAAVNSGLFPRPIVPATGDMPPGEETIRLERGGLVVWFEHLRGWSSYRFRWQDGAMRLIGYDDSGVSGDCSRTLSINYLTGRARATATPIESDRGRSAWYRARSGGRPTLDRIDVDEFIPEYEIAGRPLTCDGPGGG